jgi:hypothetical protein
MDAFAGIKLPRQGQAKGNPMFATRDREFALLFEAGFASGDLDSDREGQFTLSGLGQPAVADDHILA